MIGWMNEYPSEYIYEKINQHTNEPTQNWTNKGLQERMGERMDEFMNEWMDGWVKELMKNEWMDERMHTYLRLIVNEMVFAVSFSSATLGFRPMACSNVLNVSFSSWIFLPLVGTLTISVNSPSFCFIGETGNKNKTTSLNRKSLNRDQLFQKIRLEVISFSDPSINFGDGAYVNVWWKIRCSLTLHNPCISLLVQILT